MPLVHTSSRLSVAELEHLVPGMTVEDLEFGVLGPNDGYANPKAVLAGFREGAKTVGAEFITGEVTAIHREDNRVYGVEIERKDNINAAVVVNAAGPYAARVCRTRRSHDPGPASTAAPLPCISTNPNFQKVPDDRRSVWCALATRRSSTHR